VGFDRAASGVRDKPDEQEVRMQSDFEIDPAVDEPLTRGRADEEEQDAEQELARAAQFEFRDFPVTLPGDPLA
jgi:hypothetical protein